MFLNEKLAEAIELTQALEEDARDTLARLDALAAWAAALKERLTGEGRRLQSLLERSEDRLDERGGAVVAAVQKAREHCGTLAEAAEAAGEEAEAVSLAWTRGAAALSEGVAAARADVKEAATRVDGLYAEAVRACELVDVALLEEAAAVESALNQSAQSVDALAQGVCDALGDHLRTVRGLHESAADSVLQYLESAEGALCAAGQSLYDLGDAVVFSHNQAVHAFGDTGAMAPAVDAGVAARFIDQAPERMNDATRAASDSLQRLQDVIAAAAVTLLDAQAPPVADLASRAQAACEQIRAAAEAVPGAACASE